MKPVVCNYAILRFRPYRETGEFVNVGIVMTCPQVGFFGCQLETKKHKRITDFFPELDVAIFKAGLDQLREEIFRVSYQKEKVKTIQYVTPEVVENNLQKFQELVRHREVLFYFSEISTVMANDPSIKIKELFECYIKRQFAQNREYQETVMQQALHTFLRESQLDMFYKKRKVGDDFYNISLPFVYFDGETAKKAIKPLHLDKTETTDIYLHGDAWISKVRRLKEINCLPNKMLFAVQTPKKDKAHHKKIKAAEDICNTLNSLDIETIPYCETNRILSFARF